MWYAVETVFIDGELFGSRCCFTEGDTSPVGHCYARSDEEPRNGSKKEFDDRIEINLDWFESEEIAKDFRDGKITYVHMYDAYYNAAIKSTLKQFKSREIVAVNPRDGFLSHRGVYKSVLLDYKPYWVH